MTDAEIVLYKDDDIEKFHELVGNLPGFTIKTIKNIFVSTVKLPREISTFLKDQLGIVNRRLNVIMLLVILLIQLVIFPIVYCVGVVASLFIILKCLGPALKHFSFVRFLTFMAIAALNGPYLVKDYYQGKIPCFY